MYTKYLPQNYEELLRSIRDGDRTIPTSLLSDIVNRTAVHRDLTPSEQTSGSFGPDVYRHAEHRTRGT